MTVGRSIEKCPQDEHVKRSLEEPTRCWACSGIEDILPSMWRWW